MYKRSVFKAVTGSFGKRGLLLVGLNAIGLYALWLGSTFVDFLPFDFLVYLPLGLAWGVWLHLSPFAVFKWGGRLFFLFYPLLAAAILTFAVSCRSGRNFKQAARMAALPFGIAFCDFVFNTLSVGAESFEMFLIVLKMAFWGPVVCLLALSWISTKNIWKTLGLTIALFAALRMGVHQILRLEPETRRPWIHFHQTQYALNFSKEGFHSIQKGWSKENVTKKLGPPLRTEYFSVEKGWLKPWKTPTGHFQQHWFYSSPGEPFEQYFVYDVIFDEDGKVAKVEDYFQAVD